MTNATGPLQAYIPTEPEIEQALTYFDSAVQQRRDFREDAIAWGQFFAQEMDRRRWQLGRLAHAVVTRYGDDDHNSFAKAIGVKARTLYEYRRIHAFYLNNFCAAENLNWTHYRDATRLGTRDCALWALEKAADRGWSAEKFGVLLSRLLGTRRESDEPRPIVTLRVTSVHGTLAVRNPRFRHGRDYDVRVFEVTP